MADAKRTIELIFEGVDKTGAATQAALKNTKDFAGNIQSATQPIADFTAGALKFEAALLASGAAIAAFSVSIASNFQAALADLSKVLSDTDSIEQYKDLALELGQSYGVASVEVLKSITNYKQAGFSAQEAGQLTKSGLDLVIAGGLEATRAADLLVASIKGFGVEASESTVIVDLLNQVSNEYAATTEQLLEGFSVLSPVAQAAGLSLQETVGILTPGIEVFQSGSEVANALRTSLLRLVDDSKPVQEGLAALGVSQKDANGELRSARDIYFDVAEALQGVDQNQKLYIASQLVGINRSSEFLAVTNGLDKTLRIAGDGYNYVGSAAKEVALQLATAENATNRAQVALTNLFNAIGTPLLDEYTGIADAISAIVRSISASAQSETGVGQLVDFVESQFASLQLTLESVAKNLPEALSKADFSGFVRGVEAVAGAVGDLFGGIDLSTADGLARAIEAVGSAFNALSQFSAGVIDSFKPLASLFFDVGSGLGDIDEAAFRSAGELAGFTTQLNLLSGPAVTVAASLISLKAALDIGGAAKAAAVALGTAGGAGLVGSLTALAGVSAAGGIGYVIGDQINKLAEAVSGTSISTWALDTAASWGLLEDKSYDLVSGLNDVPPALGDVGSAADDSTGSLWDLTTGVGRLDDEFGTITDLTPYLNEIPPALDSAAGAVERLGQAAQQLDLKEKLALIEAQTAITTARIEADAQKSVAAFESISTSITSTGENLRDLYGLFSEADSISEKFFLSDQIELQNERQERALELQEKLTNEQIAASRAQRQRLDSGGALITVNGDGLQPHLEAFMWEILQSIQVRVNADGLGMLLGAP